MGEDWCSGKNSGSPVLQALKAFQKIVRSVMKERVTVVKLGEDECMNESMSSLISKNTTES